MSRSRRQQLWSVGAVVLVTVGAACGGGSSGASSAGGTSAASGSPTASAAGLDACQVFDAAAAGQLLGTSAVHGDDPPGTGVPGFFDMATCGWHASGSSSNEVSIRVSTYKSEGTAAASLTDMRAAGASHQATDVAGVGDEALSIALGGELDRFVARKGAVVVALDLLGIDAPKPSAETIATVATAVLAQLG